MSTISWSFQIKAGDLNLGGSGFAQVTGPDKLVQDLKHTILTPVGSDPDHPLYGSLFDGGVVNGVIHQPMIGQTITGLMLMEMESELRRILSDYQEQQYNRMQADEQTYNGKNTFARGELLANVNSVELKQIDDLVVAQIKMTTQDGDITLTTPVG